MAVEILGLEIGTWAEAVAALGGLAAAVVSVFALRSALAANATAERTRQEAKEFADETRLQASLQQRAQIARQLQAWWVVWHEDGVKKFGVLVTNAGEGATVFRDVRIETRGNLNAKGSKGDITFTSLPPGTYVLLSNAAGSEQPWGDPQVTTAGVAYEPLVRAQKYAVTRLTFDDPMRMSWCWTPEDGLTSLRERAAVLS